MIFRLELLKKYSQFKLFPEITLLRSNVFQETIFNILDEKHIKILRKNKYHFVAIIFPRTPPLNWPLNHSHNNHCNHCNHCNHYPCNHSTLLPFLDLNLHDLRLFTFCSDHTKMKMKKLFLFQASAVLRAHCKLKRPSEL